MTNVHPLAILILRPHRWLDTAFEKLLHRKRRDGLCRDLTSPLRVHTVATEIQFCELGVSLPV